MKKVYEEELGIMLTYYKHMMENAVGFGTQEYYRGKFEATELIARKIVLSDTVQIDYYRQFLLDKGYIKDCCNCAKNPLVNKDVQECEEDECYPGSKQGPAKWVLNRK